MDNSVGMPSLSEIADFNYKFAVSLVRHLDQADVETLVEADPNFRQVFSAMPKENFPLIQQLNFPQSTSNPICVGKLYQNVRVAINLPANHPVSQAVIQNLEHLRDVRFGSVNATVLEGTLLEQVLRGITELNSFTIEVLSCNLSLIPRQPSPLVTSPALSVESFAINSVQTNLRGRQFVPRCWIITSLLQSVKTIEVCKMPRELLRMSHSMIRLFADVSNVESYSIADSVMPIDELRNVVIGARNRRRKLVNVPYEVTDALSIQQVNQLFGNTVSSFSGMELEMGAPITPKNRIILRNANDLKIVTTRGRLLITASTLGANGRNVTLISFNGQFPADGLRRHTLTHNSFRIIFRTFGRIDFLNPDNCRLGSEDDKKTLKKLYHWVARL